MNNHNGGSHHTDTGTPYLLVLRQGLIFDRGNVALSCGLFQQLNSCVNAFYKKNIKKWTELNSYLTAFHADWSILFEQSRLPSHLIYPLQVMAGVTNGKRTTILRLHNVFVIDSSWDFNYHHLLVESATRLVRILPYLITHPKVHIHIREEELFTTNHVSIKNRQDGICIRHGVLSLLGVSPTRIISGPVLANIVLMPQDQGCGNYLEHPYELRKLAELLLKAAENVTCDSPVITASAAATVSRKSTINNNKNNKNKVHVQRRTSFLSSSSSSTSTFKKKTIVVHNRPCVKNTTWYIWRCFTDTSLRRLGAATAEAFPEHNVFVHPKAKASDSEEAGVGVADSTSSSSRGSRCRDQLACDIQQARKTDIFIGLHGAAMTNVMFMRPGSLLVEIVGYFDGKMLPICGIFGPLAAVFGVHHYVYYYDGLYDPNGLGLNSSTEGLLDVDLMMKSVREYYDHLY